MRDPFQPLFGAEPPEKKFLVCIVRQAMPCLAEGPQMNEMGLDKGRESRREEKGSMDAPTKQSYFCKLSDPR